MRSFHRDRTAAAGANDPAMSEFGDVELVDDAQQPVAQGDEVRGWDPEDLLQQQESIPVTEFNFSQNVEGVFEQIDTSGDEYLSEEELLSALKDPELSDKEQYTVRALYAAREELQSLSNDEWGVENDGVTREDLRLFDEQNRDALTRNQTATLHRGELQQFDTDGDGYFSRSELTAARNSDELSEQDRVRFRTIEENFDAIQSASNDEWGFERSGLTAADFRAYREEVADTPAARAWNLTQEVSTPWS